VYMLTLILLCFMSEGQDTRMEDVGHIATILWTVITVLVIVFLVAVYAFFMMHKKNKQLMRVTMIRKRLIETSRQISEHNTESEIIQTVVQAIIELIPNADKGEFLINRKIGFEQMAAVNMKKAEAGEIISRKAMILYQINQFKGSVIHNCFRLYRGNKILIENGMSESDSNFLLVPVINDRYLYGVLHIGSIDKDHLFKEQDLETIEQIKAELEPSIKNFYAEKKVRFLVDHDELTGVMNRRKIKKSYDLEAIAARSSQQKFCLVMIDMDDFKSYNDTYGHCFGDQVLQHFSAILTDSIKEPNLVARFAGDEFLVLLKNTDKPQAKLIMKNVVSVVAERELNGITLQFSYGICEVSPEVDIPFENALAISDVGMYKNKNKRKSNKAEIIYKEDSLLDEILQITKKCGKIMLSALNIEASVTEKSGNANFVTAYDNIVQQALFEGLQKILPEAVFIGEEEKEQKELGDGFTFIIDPIDGTTNFIKGYKYSSISVGLLRNREPYMGVVYNPYLDEIFYAKKGEGAYVNQQQIHASQHSLAEGIVVFGTAPYYPELTNDTFALMRSLFDQALDIRRSGSAALDLCNIAAGRCELYYEYRLSPWDYTAGALIVMEAGGKITTISREELPYGKSCSCLAGGQPAHEQARI